MSMTDILPAGDISKAVDHFNGTPFDYKKFFQLVGLNKKSKDILKQAYDILDREPSGFIEDKELSLFLQGFRPNARHLTDKETKDMIMEGDKDGDGKISKEDFIAMVKES